MSVTKVQASAEFAPRAIMVALMDATPFSNPVKGIVVFYAYAPDPRELVGRVQYHSEIRAVHWPRRQYPPQKPEPVYQSLVFKFDQIGELFQQLVDFGKEFGCEDHVRDCVRKVAFTNYSCDYDPCDPLGQGNSKKKDFRNIDSATLVKKVGLHSSRFQCGIEKHGYTAPIKKIDTLFDELFPGNTKTALHPPDRNQEQINVQLTLEQVDLLPIDDPAVPEWIKTRERVIEERPEPPEEEEEYGERYYFAYYSCFLDCLMCIITCICGLFGVERPEQ